MSKKLTPSFEETLLIKAATRMPADIKGRDSYYCGFRIGRKAYIGEWVTESMTIKVYELSATSEEMTLVAKNVIGNISEEKE